ncbi:hypothetical protein [Microtetraspora malaysiensis]|uniref:hypothetical protein n=1 Tax=Microtetraspora malaysiensis TaxID=161358 RepID=UPI003D91AF9A
MLIELGDQAARVQVAGQVLAWLLPFEGFDASARIFVLGPFLALLTLPVGFALIALRSKRYDRSTS